MADRLRCSVVLLQAPPLDAPHRAEELHAQDTAHAPRRAPPAERDRPPCVKAVVLGRRCPTWAVAIHRGHAPSWRARDVRPPQGARERMDGTPREGYRVPDWEVRGRIGNALLSLCVSRGCLSNIQLTAVGMGMVMVSPCSSAAIK